MALMRTPIPPPALVREYTAVLPSDCDSLLRLQARPWSVCHLTQAAVCKVGARVEKVPAAIRMTDDSRVLGGGTTACKVRSTKVLYKQKSKESQHFGVPYFKIRPFCEVWSKYPVA